MIRAVRQRTNAPSSTPIRPQLRPMPIPQRTAAILVAAGRGLRAGSGGPKQYRSIGGQTPIFPAMEAIFRHPPVFGRPPVGEPPDPAVFHHAPPAMRYKT